MCEETDRCNGGRKWARRVRARTCVGASKEGLGASVCGQSLKARGRHEKKNHQIRRIKQPRFLISRVWLKCVCESKVTSCSLIGETSFLLLKWRNIRCCLQECTFKQARFIKKKRCHCGAETWLTRKVPSVQCAQPIRAKQTVNTWGHKVWYVGWLTETAALSVLQV